MNKNKKRRGFTLVELLVVLLILGVLVGLAVPRYMESQKAARARTFAANVRQLVSALEAYRMDNAIGSDAKYPDNLSDLAEGYFTQVPINPYTGKSMLTGTVTDTGLRYTVGTGGLTYTLEVTQLDIDDVDNDDDTEETLCGAIPEMLPTQSCTLTKEEGPTEEEGTTNLLAPYVSFETDSSSAGSQKQNDGVADGWGVFVSGLGDPYRTHNHYLVPALYHGQYAQRIEITKKSNDNITNLRNVVPNCISISPNTTYTLSAYVKTNVPNKVHLMLEWYDNQLSWLGVTESDRVTVTDQVVRISLTATSPSNASYVTAYVRGIYHSGEWFEVDAIQLEPMPYATSFTLD